MINGLVYNAQVFDEYIQMCNLYKVYIQKQKNENCNFIDAVLKGLEGENEVEKELVNFPYDKLILRDICLEDQNGNTTQIDFIMITASAVYVIEVKNWATYIVFESNGKVSAKTQKEFDVMQCLEQNEHHLNVCKDYFPEKYGNLFSDICIFCNPTQKIFLEYGSRLRTRIARLDDFLPKLKDDACYLTKSLDYVQMCGIKDILLENRCESFYQKLPTMKQMEYALDVYEKTGINLPGEFDRESISNYLTYYDKYLK